MNFVATMMNSSLKMMDFVFLNDDLNANGQDGLASDA